MEDIVLVGPLAHPALRTALGIAGGQDLTLTGRLVGGRWAGIRAGGWPRTEGVQLRGKTLGLIGYGGIGAEVARIARGVGMRVLAWNRTPRTVEGVVFVDLDRLLAESHAVSLHLLLTDETRGFLSAGHIARMRPGALLVNTARGGLVDEAAMLEALGSGRLGHAALVDGVPETLVREVLSA